MIQFPDTRESDGSEGESLKDTAKDTNIESGI